jgi:2-polyprenyl-3-methyl-5-hydroxy-6-metoxy-1,4-benzoquinol methylase
MVRDGRSDDFDYSDGDAVEEEIRRIVSAAHDRSSGSEELAGHVHSWSMEYHLSPSRASILRPLALRDMEVLEVGAGCGALTRFLAEQGADVVAVEGSLRRAHIAAARCDGLPNVRVFCDTFQEFVCERRFDVVVAVGVLEYAPAFVDGRDPVVAFLERARAFLKPTGVLLIAIENQLGLKYFAGVAEDHTGELFFGIQDRYEEQHRYVTYGRAELGAKLKAAGFPSVEYLYPVPDYKLPTALFTHESLTGSDLPAAEMISRAPARDGGWPRVRLFCEAAAWEAVCRNHLAPELANSFLAVASNAPRCGLLPDGWLAAKYHGRRRVPVPSRRSSTAAAASALSVACCMTTRPAAQRPGAAAGAFRMRHSSAVRV